MKWALVIHNTALCLFSAWLCGGILIEVNEIWSSSEFSLFMMKLFCNPSPVLFGKIYWYCYLYYCSKYYELLDSVFIVMKKSKPLTFLHVFHHSLMIPVPLTWFAAQWPVIWFPCMVNAGVHVIMYAYYVAASLGFRPPFRHWITALQLLQFLCGFSFILIHFFMVFVLGMSCAGNLVIISVSFVLDLFFLYLFTSFYLEEYRRRSDAASKRGGSEGTAAAVLVSMPLHQAGPIILSTMWALIARTRLPSPPQGSPPTPSTGAPPPPSPDEAERGVASSRR